MFSVKRAFGYDGGKQTRSEWRSGYECSSEIETAVNSIHERRARLPKIAVETTSGVLWALVDDCSVANLVSPAVLSPLQSIEPIQHSLGMAGDNATLQITGLTTISLAIQEKPCKFYGAPGLNHKMIIGLTTLQGEQFIVDLTRNVLYFGKKYRITVSLVHRYQKNATLASIDFTKISQEIPEQFQSALKQLLHEHREIFGLVTGSLRSTIIVKHEICVKPFSIPPYPCSKDRRAIIEQQVQKVLEGIIVLSFSKYSFPKVLEKKKDGSRWFCINYIRLNEVTEDTSQQVPHIHAAEGHWPRMYILQNRFKEWLLADTYRAEIETIYRIRHALWWLLFKLKGAPGTFQRPMSLEVLTLMI